MNLSSIDRFSHCLFDLLWLVQPLRQELRVPLQGMQREFDWIRQRHWFPPTYSNYFSGVRSSRRTNNARYSLSAMRSRESRMLCRRSELNIQYHTAIPNGVVNHQLIWKLLVSLSSKSNAMEVPNPSHAEKNATFPRNTLRWIGRLRSHSFLFFAMDVIVPHLLHSRIGVPIEW